MNKKISTKKVTLQQLLKAFAGSKILKDINSTLPDEIRYDLLVIEVQCAIVSCRNPKITYPDKLLAKKLDAMFLYER
jgi:hypothetical protein